MPTWVECFLERTTKLPCPSCDLLHMNSFARNASAGRGWIGFFLPIFSYLDKGSNFQNSTLLPLLIFLYFQSWTHIPVSDNVFKY